MNIRMKKIDAIIIVIMIFVAGLVLYRVGIIQKPEKIEIPSIEFNENEDEETITVRSVSGRVYWKDISIEGDCDKTNLGKYIQEGDLITDCVGIINIKHIQTGELLFSYKFSPTPKLPYTIIPGYLRDVSPVDEGVHFDKISIGREWWVYTVIFSEDSELAGWSATIAFMHMAWGDFKLTFKPDILVVTLNDPQGNTYGGMINKQRKELLGILGPSTLDAKSPGVDISYENSWAKGEAPNWHLYVEDEDIDKEYEIILDLDFFAPNSPLWIHSSRLFDKGDGSIAEYAYLGCQVKGSVKIDNEEYEVEGIGHHQHSWSLGITKLAIHGWDWCHMTLDNGWNIYYNKYYLSRETIPTKSSTINPISTFIITTDEGKKITPLEDLEIITKKSDKIFLLMKMPSELSINAKASMSQLLLRTYNINLDIDIKDVEYYDKIWKFPTYLGMKIGMNSVNGKISWSDDDGDHEIELSGLGSIWNMRKF